MLFWITAICLAALGAAPVLGALLRDRDDPAPRADLAIYRDQLAEIDRDLARGVLGEEEAERTRAEVARRLLDADRRAQAAAPADAPRGIRRGAAAAVGLTVMAGGVALYAVAGAPGYPDLPIDARLELAEERRAARPSQAEAEARAADLRPAPAVPEPDFAALMDRLRAAMQSRPDDASGWALLARNEARLGNLDAARRAQARQIDLAGEEAPAPALSFMGELLVSLAGGFVSAEAESWFDRALARDPQDGRARYYKGLSLAQSGRADLAFGIWRPLLEESAPGAPWVVPIRARIGELARAAGIDYTPPAEGPGPAPADVAAAAEMDETERQAMIEGMVTRLSDRLATEGGPAADWARLLTALGVLDRRDRARAILAEARRVFANHPRDLQVIESAAARAGLAE